MSALDPRKLVGYLVVAILVTVLAVQYVLAVTTATRREQAAACAALQPAPFNPVLGKFPRALVDLQAQDYTGKMVSLSAYRDKVVLVNFWAPWCPPCVDEMPSMERLQRDMGGDAFTILGFVSEPSWEKVWPFFPKGTNLSILLDPPRGDEGSVGVLAGRWGTERLPESYLVDKQGNIRYYFVNKRDWSSSTAEACVRSLIEE